MEADRDAAMAGAAFDSAAARLELSNGTPATQHVKAATSTYLVERSVRQSTSTALCPKRPQTRSILLEPGD